MDSESRTTVNVTWSAPDVDLSEDNFLDGVRASIADSPGVTAVTTFLISEHQAVIRIESRVSDIQLASEVSAALAPEFEIQLNKSDLGEHTQLTVVPRTRDPLQDAGPARATDIDSGEYRRQTVFAGLLFASLALFLTLLTLIGDVPPGNDTQGHLFKAWTVARGAEADLFSSYGWTQDWYVGHPLFYYYAPGSAIFIGGIDYFVDNINVSYLIFIFLVMFGGAIAAYRLGRLWLEPLPAALGGTFYVAAPYTIKMAFWEGNLPRTTAIVLIPIVFYLTFRFIDSGRKRYFALLPVTVATLTLAHPMAALTTLVLVATVAAVYGSGKVPFTRIFAAGASMVLGIGLASFWLLPSISHSDLPAIPDLSVLTGRLPGSSTTLSALLNPIKQLNDFDAVNTYIGLAAIFAAVGAAIFWNRRRVALGLSAATVIGILLSMGINTPIYDIVTPLRNLLPERFLQPIALTVALLAAGAVQTAIKSGRTRGVARIFVVTVIVAIIYVDSAPFYRHVVVGENPENEVLDSSRVGEWLADNLENDRRLFVFSRVDGTTNFLPIRLGGVSSTSGWDPVGTPQTFSTSNINRSLVLEEHDYVLRTLELWDAGYAFLDGSFDPLDRLIQSMGAEGWEKVDLPFATALELYRKSGAGGGKVLINPVSVATVGAGGRAASVISPNVADWSGYTNVIEEQDIEYLSMMQGVLLFGARSRSRESSEAFLRPLLETGMSIYQEIPASAGPRMFGVDSETIRFSGQLLVRNAAGVSLIPETGIELGSFGYQGDDWTAAIITGGAEPLLTANIDGEDRVIAARRGVGTGEVIYIGLSLITHAENRLDRNAGLVIRSLLGFDKISTLTPERLATREMRWEDDSISFEYSADRDTPALLSLTYFPGWTARIDGESVQTFRHERLTLMNLPAGDHSVELNFGATATQKKAAAVSIIALLLLAGSFVPYRRLWVRYGVDDIELRIAGSAKSVRRKIGSAVESSRPNYHQFDGVGPSRTRVVQIRSGSPQMVFSHRSEETVEVKLVVLRSAEVVREFDNAPTDLPIDLSGIEGEIEIAVIVAEGVRWSLDLQE